MAAAGVAVGSGVGVSVGDPVGDGEGVTVGVGDGVTVGVGDGVTVGVGVGVGVMVGVGVGVGVGPSHPMTVTRGSAVVISPVVQSGSRSPSSWKPQAMAVALAASSQLHPGISW